MKRLALCLCIIGVLLFVWWKSPEKNLIVDKKGSAVHTAPAPSTTVSSRSPASHRVLPLLPINRKRAREVMIKLPREVAFVNEKTPLRQNEVEWRWLEGAVAIKKSIVPSGIPIISERAGFVIVASSEVPQNVVSYPLVERTDNGVKGIFTGVIKAMGGGKLESAGQFMSQCPVEMVQSFPSIKSYLLKIHRPDELEESMTCLKTTGLFKHLEWEILSSPNVQQ